MTLGSHQKTIGDTQTWITPKWILDALGPFDLDPCAADPRPWDCAHDNWPIDGLDREWHGRVWLNPPFHRYEIWKWLKKMSDHGNGTTLVHARTEADWFDYIWDHAKAILFFEDRIHFHYPDGKRAAANSGAPPVLAAFGELDAEWLGLSGIPGRFVTTWKRI